MKKLWAIALLAPLAAWAETNPVSCPASLEINSLASAPAGWTVLDAPESHVLDRIGFFSGPPAELVSLVPDKAVQKKGESRDVWTFPPEGTERVWASCFYTGTSLSVSRPMNEGVQRCEVRYRTTRNGSRIGIVEAGCE